jgi:Tol biopolymer transport system component
MVKSSRWLVLLSTLVMAAGWVMLVAPSPAGATYPGEPGRVAYTERQDRVGGGSFTEIHTMNPDGSDRRRVTFDGGSFVKRVMGPDGSEDDPYVNLYTWSATPRWSPDGSMLAFLHYAPDDTTQVQIVDSSSGHVEVLLADWNGTMLSWSPDGQKIAYGDDRGVWVADTSGANATLVASPSLGLPPSGPGTPSTIREVEWSPDGKRLGFIEWTGGGLVAGTEYVSVIDVDGSDRQSNVCQSRPDTWTFTLGWAPDGSTVLCDDRTRELISVEPDGTNLVVLTAGGHAVWSPDGAQILFADADPWDERRALWSYDIASRSTQQVLPEFRGTELNWQPVPLIPQPVGLVDPLTGVWRIANSDGVVRSFYYGNPGDYPIMGDWDCDSIDTPGLYRQSDGYVYLRNSNTQGNADIRFYFGNPGDFAIAGDFNRDGCDTVSIYRQTEGRVYVINELGANDGGLGAADYAYYFGNPGDKPFVGDFNADGIDTVGLHRESTGLVYFRNTNTQGTADSSFYFGDPGDRLITGDWNQDNNDTPAIYRPEDRTFYLRYTITQGNANEQFLWGWPHWIPVSGQTG